MEEPSPRSSRLALAGGLAAAIIVGGAGFLLGRATSEPAQVAVAPAVPAPATAAAPTPETRQSVLGRSELIALAAEAADAAAAGREPGERIAEAEGRRFEVRLPFGCEGPAAQDSNAAMRWRYDEAAQALRIHVRPVAWSPEDWLPPEAAQGVETIEGFWIARPWTSSDACPGRSEPAAAAGTEPVTLAGQTLALAQIHSAQGPRGSRRNGEAYEAVVRISRDRLDSSAGFRLRISGRIEGAPGARPLRCRQPGGPEQRPVCLVGILMDEVAIEHPGTGQTLARWDPAT